MKVNCLTELKDQLIEDNKVNSEAAKKLEAVFNSSIGEVIQRFIKDKVRGKIGRDAFPLQIKQFAVTVFFFSPAAYAEVRKSILNDNAIGLNAGIVLDMIIAKTQCTECISYCIDNELHSRKFGLLKFKRHPSQPQPSEELFKICVIVDKTFRMFIKIKGDSIISNSKFDDLIFNRVAVELQSAIIFKESVHGDHHSVLLKTISSLYVRIKKKALIKSINVGNNKLIRPKLNRLVNLQNH